MGQPHISHYSQIERLPGVRGIGYARVVGRSAISVTELLSDTDLTYTAGSQNTVTVGEELSTREGYRYEVLDSGVAEFHVQTDGGVKLNVLSGEDGWMDLEAFGIAKDGSTDNAAVMQKAWDAGGNIRVGPGRIHYNSTLNVTQSDWHLQGSPGTVFVDNGVDPLPYLVDASGSSDADGDLLRHITVDNLRFDVAVGQGGVRLRRTRHVTIRDIHRDGPTAGNVGSSVVHLGDGNNAHVLIENISVDSHPASATRVVIGSRSWDITLNNITLNGGGAEAIDLNGCYDVKIDGVYGEELTDEVLDLGNCSRVHATNITGKNVARLITLKTEATGFPPPQWDDPNGCNDNRFTNLTAIDYVDYGIFYGAGSTAAQTLNGNQFSGIRLTSAASGATAGIRLASGDDTAGDGTMIRDAVITALSGSAVSAPTNGLRNLHMSHVDATGTVSLMSSSSADPTTQFGHRIEHITVQDGDFQHRNLTDSHLRSIQVRGGRFRLTDVTDSVVDDIAIRDAPDLAALIEFNAKSASALRPGEWENLTIRGLKVINANLTSGSNSVRWDNNSGATVRGVTLDGFFIADYQGTPTTQTVAFATNIDEWKCINSYNKNATGATASLVNGVRGSKSINENNLGVMLSEAEGTVTFSGTDFISANIDPGIRPIRIDDVSLQIIGDGAGAGDTRLAIVRDPTSGNGFRVQVYPEPGTGNTITVRWRVARRQIYA